MTRCAAISEMAARDRIERGEPADEARRAARREFGNVGLIKEVTREMWGWSSLERLWQDLRYGVRLMRRNPGFTAVAILSLGLGIGANTAMFTVVESVLLRPLPYHEPDRLVMVYSVNPNGPFASKDGPFFDPDYLEFRKLASFSHISMFTGTELSLVDSGEPSRVQGAEVTASLFPLLGVQPLLGRAFADDEEASRAPVAVIGEALWRGRYQAAPGVIGQSVKIDGVTHTIVGVMPARFNFPADTLVWKPLHVRPDYRDNLINRVIARLAPGVTVDQARSEVEALLRNLGKSLPPDRRLEQASIVDLRESIVGDVRWLLVVLLGAVGCVVLIACTNVANLLMARGSGRGREMAIRSSFGASRLRLLRQLLTESVTLAIGGGLVGLVLANVTLTPLRQWVPPDMLPRIDEVHLNVMSVAFTFLLCLATSVTFGLAPALMASSTRPHGSTATREIAGFHQLRTGRGTTSGDRRLRGFLIVFETAMVLVLLIGAGLLLKSFWRLQHVDPGFRPDDLFTLTIALPDETYRTSQQKRQFYSSLLERLQAVPSVSNVAAINLLPFGLFGWQGDFEVEGREANPVSLIAGKPAVSEDYFRTVGIPLRRGRFFDSRDRDGSQLVAIVSDAVARACWPGRDPIGQRLMMDDRSKSRWLTVVGVVGDVRQYSLAGRQMPMIYVPIGQEQRAFFLGTMTYVMRPQESLERVGPALRENLRALDRELPVQRMAYFDRILENSVAEPRFRTGLLLTFGLLALVLALVGIHGIVSYEVARRTPELGIRRALGAGTADVVRLVVGRTAGLVAIGLATGIPVAIVATRVLKRFLFAVEPTDVVTFVLVSTGLALVALLASLLPARRAARVDPVIALRQD